MRIAILGSPRSGNNWFRRILAESLQYPSFASHTLGGFGEHVQENVILNIHEIYSDESKSFFGNLDCRCVALARHPFDVLVSVLQFGRKMPDVDYWLSGACEVPSNISSLLPNDPEFVDWMCSEGAQTLLSVSCNWWTASPTSARVKYEELIDDAPSRITRVVEDLGLDVAVPVEKAIEAHPFEWFLNNNNGWIGDKENYRRFFTEGTIYRLIDNYEYNLRILNYTVEDSYCSNSEKATDNYLSCLPE